MSTHTVIYQGGDQSISTVAYNAQGEPVQPTSATYHIVDLRRGEESTERDIVASGTAATVDSVSTTTTADAGPSEDDDRAVTLTSVAGVTEGTRYLLEQDGRRELLEADRISGLVAYGRDRLRLPFSTGASFLGVEVTATFPSAEAADEQAFDDSGGPYAIDWTFVGGGEPKREIIWLKRRDDPVFGTVEGMTRRDQLVGRETGDPIDLRVALKAANDDLAADLRNLGHDPTRLNARTLDLMAEYLACAKVRCEWAAGQGAQAELLEMAKKHEERYQHLLNALTQGRAPEGTVKTNEDDAAEAGTTTEFGSWFQRV